MRKVIITMVMCMVLSIVGHSTASATYYKRTVTTTWAFCGVHPDMVNAAHAVAVLAHDAGITATMGPCMPTDMGTYTPSNTGTRYVDPATYMRVLLLNATVGMDTVVYDARLWSTNLFTRLAALMTWYPYRSHIAAFDMGDEFDPKGTDWAVLVKRWNTMELDSQFIGIHPYTNHLPFAEVLDQAIADLGNEYLSFDSYDPATAEALTLQFAPQVKNLMVAIDALRFSPSVPVSESTITSAMTTLHADGADAFLIFGGSYPYNADLSPAEAFGGYSLIDSSGNATPWAAAVLAGTK